MGWVEFFVRLWVKVENITVQTFILNGSSLLECPPSSEIWENARKIKIKQLILRLNGWVEFFVRLWVKVENNTGQTSI